MERKVTRTVKVCDCCGKEYDYGEKCRHCGRDFCHTCAEKHGKQYHAGVFFSGSGDSFYCYACDKKLATDASGELHSAYRAIAALTAEYQEWQKAFELRKRTAELRVESLLRGSPR